MSSRTEIIDASAELFRSRGYGATGVAEILSRAGYKPPTLYYHFGDKEGLYVAWCERELAELGQSLRTATAASHLIAIMLEPSRPDPLSIRRDLALLVRAQSREAVLRSLGLNVDEPLTNAYFSLVGPHGPVELVDAWITGLLGAASAMRVPAPRGKPVDQDLAARWALKSEVGWRSQSARLSPDAVE
jgi:AcrR family transcriptional regulator